MSLNQPNRYSSKIKSVATRYMNPALFGDGYPGFIYFIQMGEMGPIKIGYAKDHQKRLAGIKTASPFKINLLYATPGSLQDEQMIHRQLRKNHFDLWLKGEWYHPGKVIFKTIDEFKKWDERDAEHLERKANGLR